MERCVYYLGGPLDGHMQLVDSSYHPFAVDVSTDTDGFYVMQYQVADERIGDLQLTADDIVARWRQRSSPDDYMTGDTVIVKATGARAMVVSPMTVHHDHGAVDSGWLISLDARQIFVRGDQIRIATAAELSGDQENSS